MQQVLEIESSFKSTIDDRLIANLLLQLGPLGIARSINLADINLINSDNLTSSK